MLRNLHARFPKLFPVMTAVVLLGGAGGAAAYERLSHSCCSAGAACCYPGSPCCNGAHRLAQK
jgi:hypothetical protein